MKKKVKAIADETIGICAVCNRKVHKDNKVARMIDGLLVCCPDCVDKFFKEKKKWTAENWDAICKLQALYEERKRKETKASCSEETRRPAGSEGGETEN